MYFYLKHIPSSLVYICMSSKDVCAGVAGGLHSFFIAFKNVRRSGYCSGSMLNHTRTNVQFQYIHINYQVSFNTRYTVKIKNKGLYFFFIWYILFSNTTTADSVISAFPKISLKNYKMFPEQENETVTICVVLISLSVKPLILPPPTRKKN